MKFNKIQTDQEKKAVLEKLILQQDRKTPKSEAATIRIRNLKRFYALQFEERFYCPAIAQSVSKDEIMRCMLCKYGHITSCHFPHTCNSPYCTKYQVNSQKESRKAKAHELLDFIEHNNLTHIHEVRHIKTLLERSFEMGYFPKQIDELYNTLTEYRSKLLKLKLKFAEVENAR